MQKVIIFILLISFFHPVTAQPWQSKWISVNEDHSLVYHADSEGNTIPDFSRVGYASGEKQIPVVPVVEVVRPVAGENLKNIQDAIDRVALLPLDKNGFRGTVLLKKGTYNVNGTILITHSGIVIRGEGFGEDGTVIRETAPKKINLFNFRGDGEFKRQESSKMKIIEDFVPVGRKYVILEDASAFHVGEKVLLFRPGTDNWIHDLKMDQIEVRKTLQTVQWQASRYDLWFERIIAKIEGNKVYLDNPVVMQMDKKYGGGYLMKYTFNGRIKNCGIENLLLESTYTSDTDENHGWNAVLFSKTEQGWAQNAVARYFGYACINIDRYSKNISVLNCKCLDAKSVITGGRRYSFNCNGQLNLFKNCYTTEGRHDFVTGACTCGPNVFTQCKSVNPHSDIGPHHRWASGTLYDLIETEGEINVQDRGNYGTGHGWAGVTQVLWNCRSPKTAVQSPWVSGKNYCIGLNGGKSGGRFPDRPDGEWEGHNSPGLQPESLYEAQVKSRNPGTIRISEK